MAGVDFALYAVHGAFWGSFGVTRAVLSRRQPGASPTGEPEPSAPVERSAPFSRTVLAVHFVAFGVMYFGIGKALFGNQVPAWFPGHQLVGTAVIASGAFLMCWALVYFQSWRFRAKLDAGHRLATGGPFQYFRHPIYMGLNLLALGSAIWVPTTALWIGFALMVIGSDLRGRAEERLLSAAFGEEYVRYCGRTRRFLPGIY